MARVITVTLNPCIDKTLTVCGFKAGAVNRSMKSVLDAGGKGVNVSRVLTDFGVDNTAVGILGRENSTVFKRKLDSEAVRYEFYEVGGETRTNYKIFDEANGETTDINEPGLNLTADNISGFTELYKKHIADAEYLVLSGSIPPGASADSYRKLTEIAKDIGIKVILDASGEALTEGIKAKPYAVKPNIYELEELLGRELTDTDAVLAGMREIMGMGVEVVSVSMGGDGAIFMQGDEVYKTKALAVDVKSTVGCGDSVVAGMVYSMVNGFDLKKMAKISAAAGSITAGKEGTRLCRCDEVKDMWGKVEVYCLNI